MENTKEQSVKGSDASRDLFDHIPLLRPWLGKEEFESVNAVIASGWVSQGPKVQTFENAVAAFLGAEYAVATNSCTSAIHLGLRLQNIQPDDEVILSNITCMADVNAVKMAGAIPALVDIDPLTYNIDTNLIERAITNKTKAILTIDQIGLASDLDKVKDIANKHNFAIVDDAATALGGKYKGKYIGAQGLVTTFSFHPRKMITTGEGGMLITNDPDLAGQARVLRSAGASVSDLERHKAKGTVLQEYRDYGYNYRMTDVQAAMGLVQMTRLPEMIRQRREQAEFYNEAFNNIQELVIPHEPEYATHCYSSYLLKLTHKAKLKVKDVIEQMAAKNISCRYGIQPLHREPYFDHAELGDSAFPVSCNVADHSFFIPIFPGLKQEQLKYIADSIKSLFLNN